MQLKKLKNYAEKRPGFLSKLARHLNISNSYLSQMVHGYRPMPHEHAVSIELFTDGAISRLDCCPDDAKKVWPELFEKRKSHE